MYSFSPLRIPRSAKCRNFLWVIQLWRTRDSDTWAAARILPRECSSSSSPGGQMQGSIGVFISHRSNTTSRFCIASLAASLTATVVFPEPGLPQTANIWLSDPASISVLSLSALRLKILFLRKFKAYSPSLSSIAGSTSPSASPGIAVLISAEVSSLASSSTGGYKSFKIVSCASMKADAFVRSPR